MVACSSLFLRQLAKKGNFLIKKSIQLNDAQQTISPSYQARDRLQHVFSILANVDLVTKTHG